MLNKKEIQKQMKYKLCIECKNKIAHYWSNHLCEDCYRKYLKEKVEGER